MSRQTGISSRKTAERLHATAIHLLRKLRREDEAGSLTAPRLSALSVIVFTGPLTLCSLAAAEQVRPPTMTRIVGGLERLGLVERNRNAEDGRRVFICTTAAGKRVFVEARRRRIQALVQRIDGLEDAEQALLHKAARVMEKLVAGI